MKVYLSSWIKRVNGYLDGLVIYAYPEMHGVCYARSYIKSPLTAHNHYYGDCFKAIINNIWKTASPGFKQDLKIYTKAWNQTQRSQDLNKHHYNSLNILIKACFIVAREKDFDLRTLNLENFAGSPTSLLGNQEPTVGNLVKAAKMPECGVFLERFSSRA